MSTDRAWSRLGLVVMLAAFAGTATAVTGEAGRGLPCLRQTADPAYTNTVLGALGQREDVWGNALIRSPGGPTYEGAARYLNPLMLVGRPAGLRPTYLTDSGVYYLPFGMPRGPYGADAIQLHVADGGQIVSDRVDGTTLSLDVGPYGNERYGSCLARLAPPKLWNGYQPILETSYVDARGVHYRQESFAARIPQTRALVSFVRLSVDPRGSRVGRVTVRFTPSLRHLHRVGHQLRLGRKARLLFSRGGRFDGHSLVFRVGPKKPRTVFVAWLDWAARARPVKLRPAYRHAKRSVVRYWDRRLARGAAFVVPEKRVYDAERNLLIQNMLMSWRYSLGNAYERFSWELIDVGEVMGDYGYRAIERAILRTSLRSTSNFPNRAAGERMTGSAHYYRRFGDRRYIRSVTPLFRRYLSSFEHQLSKPGRTILGRERYGADILQPIYGLHAQALTLQGIRSMSLAWRLTGNQFLANKAAELAARLDAGLRSAVRSAQTSLPDGSLFVPISLLDRKEQPYDLLTASKRGAYWNLTMPYVLASGLFPPGSPESTGLLRYMLNHGSRFLGLVRFNPHTGVQNPGYETAGSDDVYGTNVARFLADNDQADQLVLSLYGKLAAGMTPNTFVAGEGSTIAPVGGRYYRTMHRPPNSGNNAFFLESLRLALVHETRDAGGAPTGLELAYSTPRAWLRAGEKIEVRGARTSFGPLSYSIDSQSALIRVRLNVPSQALSSTLRLRLRLPAGERLGGISVEGRAFHRFDSDTETIDLSGLKGRIELVAHREEAARPEVRPSRGD